MPLEIPLDPNAPPVDAFTVTLDGTPYQIQIAFNARAGRWSASILDAGGVPIFSASPLRVGTPLWEDAREGAPPGRFVVIALGEDQTDPGAALTGELGARVFLLYYTAAEREAL